MPLPLQQSFTSIHCSVDRCTYQWVQHQWRINVIIVFIELESLNLYTTSVRVQPCVLNSMLLWYISKALLHTLMHCIPDSACYATPHCPLHLHPCTCCFSLLVCLFVYLCHQCMCCLPCLFASPSSLFLLIDGQQANTKSNCTCSIRRGLGRRLRSSLLLNSSPSTSRDHPLVT